MLSGSLLLMTIVAIVAFKVRKALKISKRWLVKSIKLNALALCVVPILSQFFNNNSHDWPGLLNVVKDVKRKNYE